MLKISKLRRKCIFMCIFFAKYLVISKKSSNFASAFEKQVCFYFLPQKGIKIRFFLEGPNFFALCRMKNL